MTVKAGYKFGCVTLAAASTTISDPIHLSNELSIHPKFPLDTIRHWEADIGSIQANVIRDSNFVILVTAPSNQPNIIDQQSEDLKHRAYQYLHAILLLGVPEYQSPFAMAGENSEGQARIKSLTQFIPHYTHASPTNLRLTLSNEHVREANEIFEALEWVENQLNPYAPLSAGLRLYFKALREKAGEERILHLVRALDALVLTKQSKGKATFKERAKTFGLKPHHTVEILDDMFELRSKAVHARSLNELFDSLDSAGKERRALTRVRQAEVLARHSLREILLSPNLRSQFATTDGANRYWGEPELERRKLLSQRVDVTTVV